MERAPLTTERVITHEERERINCALASYGLYDASLDTYQITEHPEDDQWIIKSEN